MPPALPTLRTAPQAPPRTKKGRPRACRGAIAAHLGLECVVLCGHREKPSRNPRKCQSTLPFENTMPPMPLSHPTDWWRSSSSDGGHMTLSAQVVVMPHQASRRSPASRQTEPERADSPNQFTRDIAEAPQRLQSEPRSGPPILRLITGDACTEAAGSDPRLTVILAADTVGYTRRIAADEARMHANCADVRLNIIEPGIRAAWCADRQAHWRRVPRRVPERHTRGLVRSHLPGCHSDLECWYAARPPA